MEAMQRVITAEEQVGPEQQPNHFEEAEKMQEEEDVQDTGKSIDSWLVWLVLFEVFVNECPDLDK